MVVEGRARAERTLNMDIMFVTLDVSKLSGWLNATALCQAEREASEEGDARAARQEGVGRQRRNSVPGGPNYGGSWQGTRGAHVKHVLHVCNAGGVEA